MERALLVNVKLKQADDGWGIDDISDELHELAKAAGAEVVDEINCIIDKPTPNYFIGRGKVEEIADLAYQVDAQTVLFSHDLSGTHQRNLEEVIKKKTIDRTQLILDIFCRHAHSPEGKMQVELAQLQYLLPRLVGKGLILSRQGGGIGTSGPGEQKLEVDRRRIRKRIEKLKADIRQVSLHRRTLRKQRTEGAVPTIALVGYTNAGKSTLLNALTGATQKVQDSLFTTLDPLSQALKLPNGETVVVSDTVGFLHDLPHHLVESFKATLEEVVEADLLIHVIDSQHPRINEHYDSVLQVLEELTVLDKPRVTVLNKIDLIDDQVWLAKLQKDFSPSVSISALKKIGFDLLYKAIEEHFRDRVVAAEISVPQNRMDLVAMLYREGKVKEVKYLSKAIHIKVILSRLLYNKLLKNKEIENC